MTVDPIGELPATLEMMLAVRRDEAPVSTAPPSVETRVQAAIRGDRKAADELLTELLPRVRNLARFLLRGDDDVDDVAQEALIQVYRSLGSYRGEGSLRSWADRIVVRVTMRARRKRGLHAARTAPGPDVIPLPDPGPLPDRRIGQRELAAMLDELPDKQRTALVLHHAVGMSVAEVAEAIDVPVETVRSRLRLGAARLRERIGRGEA